MRITYKSKYPRISHITVTTLNASAVYRFYICSCRLSTLFMPPKHRCHSSTPLFRPILLTELTQEHRGNNPATPATPARLYLWRR